MKSLLSIPSALVFAVLITLNWTALADDKGEGSEQSPSVGTPSAVPTGTSETPTPDPKIQGVAPDTTEAKGAANPGSTGSNENAGKTQGTQSDKEKTPQPIVDPISPERKAALEDLRHRHLWIAYGAAWLLVFGFMYRTSRQNESTGQEIEALKRRLARIESSDAAEHASAVETEIDSSGDG